MIKTVINYIINIIIIVNYTAVTPCQSIWCPYWVERNIINNIYNNKKYKKYIIIVTLPRVYYDIYTLRQTYNIKIYTHHIKILGVVKNKQRSKDNRDTAT